MHHAQITRLLFPYVDVPNQQHGRVRARGWPKTSKKWNVNLLDI